MNINIKQIVLSAVLVSASGLFGAGVVTPEGKEMVRNAELARQENLNRGDYLVRQGHKLFEEGNYFGARDKYLEAIKLFRQYPSKFFMDKIEFCQKEIAACYYAKANEAIITSDKMALASDFDEAIKICKEAIKYCPEQADELQKRVYLYEKRRDSTIQRSAFATDRLIPDKAAQEYQIQVLLEQARRLALVKDYSGALFKYNEVLLIDPYNADATQGRRAISRRIGKMGEERYVNSHRRAMAELEWKYALPIIPETSGSGINEVTSAVEKPEIVQASKLLPKLNKITISGLNFDSRPISVIVNYLQEQSRRNDPDQNSASKGVNIIYIGDVRNGNESPEAKKARDEARAKRNEERRQKQAAAKKANADGEAEEEGSSDQNETEQDPYADEPKVTLISGRERTLHEALTLLCRSAKPNLNMQIDDYAVVLTPEDVTLNNMMLRSYPVTISGEDSNKSDVEISEAMKNFLKSEGGPSLFPNGSALYYNPETRRASITNTRENHQKLQALIDEHYKPKDSTMVQVMVKLVDINQNDLDELAFNWQLAINSAKNREENGKFTRSFITEPNNPLLRYYDAAGSATVGDLQGSLLSYVWENEKGTRVVASMFAMNQADSSDVLMAPRVTVKEGVKAVVKMDELHFFPEAEWTTIEGEWDNNAKFNSTSQPDLSDEQNLGITFEITPEVNGRLISANIGVQFKTLAGWDEYDTRQYDEEGNLVDGDYQRMPILNNPSISTYITAQDGETVIAGGIVVDQSSSINDKIPILGDIPFIGRFFQSKGTKSTKRNLLVFVTFRLVKPDGSPVYPRYKNDGLYPQGYPRFGSGL